MLKIIDSVDLKELEQFGFEYIDPYYTREVFVNGISASILFVDTLNRNLSIKQVFHDCQEYILFDLIQAGLVEKVES